MTIRHLALAVADQERSRAFYERHFGFGARPARRCSDGVLMLYDAGGFALALGPAEGPVRTPAFLHFGFAVRDRDEVRARRAALAAAGVPIVEEWDEPGYASVKCRDPDGYVLETFWEALPTG